MLINTIPHRVSKPPNLAPIPELYEVNNSRINFRKLRRSNQSVTFGLSGLMQDMRISSKKRGGGSQQFNKKPKMLL